MSHYKILSSAIAIAALVTVTSAAQADMYYGPAKVADKCFKRGGSGESMGYWDNCPAARAANASISRPARAQRTRTAKKAEQ
jgi:hypothetical protein